MRERGRQTTITYSHVFWIDLNNLINDKIDSSIKLNVQNVLFGLSKKDVINVDKLYIVNLLLILAKYHIHCAKFANHRPNVIVLKAVLFSYLETIKHCKNTKAIKTQRICDEYFNDL